MSPHYEQINALYNELSREMQFGFNFREYLYNADPSELEVLRTLIAKLKIHRSWGWIPSSPDENLVTLASLL